MRPGHRRRPRRKPLGHTRRQETPKTRPPAPHEEWFPRFAAKFKRMLWSLLIISAVVHVLVMIIVGSMVIYRKYVYKEVQLEAAPEIEKTIRPREIEHTVKVQEQQRRSGRPLIEPRLLAQRISDFSLPAIGALPDSPRVLVAENLKPFGKPGMGSGLGGDMGAGGLGLGVSTVRFFGITDRGEKIAFLVDISLSMAEDDKGGEAGFAKLKAEIGDMIGMLSPGTFFNLILFGSQVDLFEQQMVLASDSNKKRAYDFLGPYLEGIAESQPPSGNILNNYEPRVEGIPAASGSTRMDLGITAAFEQSADVILLISDGRPRITKRLEGRDLKKFQERMAEAMEENEDDGKRMAEFMREQAQSRERRRQKGLPPKISETRPRPPPGSGNGPPPPPGPPSWDNEDIIDHIEHLGKILYKEKGHPTPRINCVAFVCQRKDEDFMKRLARKFHGDFKRAKARVKPIVE